MVMKTNIRVVGTGHYLYLPKSIIDVFNLLDDIEDYEYDISYEKNKIIYTKVKKEKPKNENTN